MKNKIFLLPVICVVFLSACRQQEYKETKLMLDTACEITVISSNKLKAEKAINEAFKEIERIDKLCGYGKESEVSGINTNAGVSSVKTDKELYDLIEESVRIADFTSGAFDITVGPLISLWGFDTAKPSLPSKSEIKRILPLVNYKNIKLDSEKSTVFLVKKGMKIDLGGIAKKYAMRMAMHKLLENGIKKALVNLGGDIQVRGGALDNQPWKIGVKHPRKPDELATIFKFKDKTIVTSGDYERYFINNGIRYHHIFDPHTGYPAKKVISATVITDGPIIADVFSTAMFTLGIEKSLTLLKKIPGTEVLIINETKRGNEIILSEGLKKMNLALKF